MSQGGFGDINDTAAIQRRRHERLASMRNRSISTPDESNRKKAEIVQGPSADAAVVLSRSTGARRHLSRIEASASSEFMDEKARRMMASASPLAVSAGKRLQRVLKKYSVLSGSMALQDDNNS